MKKKFPKFNKSLKKFLTDESGKITKKDAIGLSAAATILSGVDDVLAASSHFNKYVGGGTTNNYIINYNASATCNVNHASGIVNGHYSSTPGSTVNVNSGISSISGHGSHSSHGSGGWC